MSRELRAILDRSCTLIGIRVPILCFKSLENRILWLRMNRRTSAKRVTLTSEVGPNPSQSGKRARPRKERAWTRLNSNHSLSGTPRSTLQVIVPALRCLSMLLSM